MSNRKELIVYCSSENTFRDSPCNAGVDAALACLIKLGVRVVDSSLMSDEERYSRYSESVTGPATRSKHSVRTVFGTHRSPGSQFGLGTPALVVLDERGNAQEIYPHRESGRLVTIADAVARLNP